MPWRSKILTSYLTKTNIPILSEEGKDIAYDERKNWEYFWLIDPLDGTKEFIHKNGDFTINIALIYEHRPILGIVYSPVHQEMYWGDEHIGAFFAKVSSENVNQIFEISQKLHSEKSNINEIRIVASRSHLSEQTQNAIDFVASRFNISFKSRGSSLKMCLLASGQAEYYPRFSPTMEWDTAAGQAVLLASGGKIIETQTLEVVRYNKESLLNPFFYAFSASIVDNINDLII